MLNVNVTLFGCIKPPSPYKLQLAGEPALGTRKPAISSKQFMAAARGVYTLCTG